jgi:hypothetical protein
MQPGAPYLTHKESPMNLKAKGYIQNQKTEAQQKLANRIALLESQGQEGKAVTRDAIIKKLQADIRKASRRLAQVAAQEKLIAQKQQTKTEKAAAEKEKAAADTPKIKKAAPKPTKAAKKEKKAAAK